MESLKIMNLKVFDIVELTDESKVIVTKVDRNDYIVKNIDNSNCKLISINEADIKKILFKK